MRGSLLPCTTERSFDGYLDRLHYVDAPEHFVDESVMIKGKKIEDVVVPFLRKAGVLKMPESLVL